MIVLHCSSTERDAKFALRLARLDGLSVEFGRQAAYLPNSEIEILYRSFEQPRDAEKVMGMEISGVIGLSRVTDRRCRDTIMSRMRP